MKVICLGRGKLGYVTISKILEKGYEVPVIVTTQHTPNVEMCSDDFKSLSKKYNIPFFYTKNINDKFFVDMFTKFTADIAVALLWIHVIQNKIIETTRLGFLNIHPGEDLPHYRGNATTNWALIKNEQKIGLCVHFMEPGVLDSGDIVAQRYIDLTPQTTIGDITKQIITMGSDMVIEALDLLSTGKAQPQKQNYSQGIRNYPRIPQDGEICWTQSVEQIDRHIRSVSEPFPGAFTFIGGRKLYIWAAHPLKNPPIYLGVPGHVVGFHDDNTISVLTGHGGILILDTVQIEGDEKVKPAEIIRSIRVRLGMNCSEEILQLKNRVERLEKRHFLI